MTGISNRVRNLLVLEDEPLIAMMLQDELESLGVHVIGPVSNLKSALRIAKTLDLDGALLDRNINGTFADDVADALHSRNIPFVFVEWHCLICSSAPSRNCAHHLLAHIVCLSTLCA